MTITEPDWCGGDYRCLLIRGHNGDHTPNLTRLFEGVDSAALAEAQEAP